MGPDFEVAEPTDFYIGNMSLFPQPAVQELQGGEDTSSQKVEVSEDGTMEVEEFEGAVRQSGVEELTGLDENKPQVQEPINTMAPELDDTDHTQDVYFADPITSFRQILKRYNFYTTDFLTQAGTFFSESIRPNFPLHRGYAPGGVNVTGGGNSYNYVNMTLLNYVTPAYGAYRGGIRWKVLASHFNNSNAGMLMVKRNAEDTLNYNTFELAIGNGTGTPDPLKRFRTLNVLPSCQDGMIATTLNGNPVLEYETPFYDNRRFYPAKRVDNLDFYSLKGTHTVYDYSFATASQTKSRFYFNAVGEDFNLAFFLGAPIYYYYNNPVT
jgi:hypothetical protein